MTCPAVAVEVAPEITSGNAQPTDVADTGYQTRVARPAAAIVEWRSDSGGGNAAMIPLSDRPVRHPCWWYPVVMGGVLWRLRERAHDRLVHGLGLVPTQAPLVAPLSRPLAGANDTDNSLLPQTLSLPLPESPGAVPSRPGQTA